MPLEKFRKVRSSYPRFWVHEKHQEYLIAGQQKNKLPPLEILKWIFRYDIDTGKLYRIRDSSGKTWNHEKEITTVNSKGYLVVSITDSEGLKKAFFVHHICFYIHSGVEPLQLIDHINGNPTDNRFSNLRLANSSENNRNAKMRNDNASGFTGIYWYKPTGKWVAQAYDNSGRRKHLGLFDDKEAAAAVVSAHYSNPVNGFTERHGI